MCLDDAPALTIGFPEPGREKIDISIVIPVFNEGGEYPILYERILVTLGWIWTWNMKSFLSMTVAGMTALD